MSACLRLLESTLDRAAPIALSTKAAAVVVAHQHEAVRPRDGREPASEASLRVFSSHGRLAREIDVAAEVREDMLLERQQLTRRRAEEPRQECPRAASVRRARASELGRAFAEDEDAAAHAGRAR